MPEKLTEPLLYLSSVTAGWEGLLVEAFHEPPELESWISPASQDVALVLFAGGTMHMAQRQINGPWQTWDASDGDLILPSGIASEVRWKAAASIPTQTLHLRLSRDLVARAAEEVTSQQQVSLIPRSGFRDPLLLQICLSLWNELGERSPAGKLYAQTAAQMIAVHLLRHYSTTPLEIKGIAQGLTQRQIKRVTDFVLAHLNQDLSLETLAAQTGFSSYHFARLFRQTMGKSPHQFVLQLRLEKAQRLLKETDIPLAHVALESGFANQSHLTRHFKRCLGLTPRAYRQDS